jgi:hypothetical protein
MFEKKRLNLFVFLLAVSLFAAMASAETSVFNDRVLSGESVEIDEFTFIITMNKYANAIFVDAGEMFQTVALYDCEKMERFRICFKNTTYDEGENELYALVAINRSKPDVSITRQINQTELYVGQEAEVTLTIVNTGDTAPQIIVTDDYPASIEIYDMEGGCREHENQVYWKGHLDEDESRECTFLIRPTKELHQGFVAHLKYWDGFKWIDEYSVALTLDVEPVLEIFSALIREDYEVDGTDFDYGEDPPILNIGETARLLVNITNNFHERVDVNKFELNLPPYIRYRSIGHLRFNYVNASGNRSSIVWYSDSINKLSDRTLRWSGRINEGDSKQFILKLRAERTGNQNVLLFADYEYDSLRFDESWYESFDVGDPGIVFRMAVEDKSKRFAAPERLDEEEDTIDLEALHPYHVRIYAQNVNKYSKLSNVNIKVGTELAGFKDVRYPEMAEEGQRIPYSIELIPPYVVAHKEFKMNVSATYTNDYGEKYYNSTEFKVSVFPTKDITIDIDSDEGFVLDGNEETEIAVTLTNDRLIDIPNVQVRDEIYPALPIEGVHAKKLKLLKDTDTEVYKYRMTMPVVHNKSYYNITTTVSFFDPDLKRVLNFTKTKEITVRPMEPELNVDLTVDEPDNVYPGTIIPAEYKLKNEEEEEIIRDITVYFPIHEGMDLIGPRTFFVDKLDPGEEIRIPNLVKFRPKLVQRNFKINLTKVVFHDNYGNRFYENTSAESVDVAWARINGPSIFLRTVTPDLLNKSTDGTVRIEVKNNGSDAADVMVEQGNRSWNLTVAAASTSAIDYTVRYDMEGNYTLPDPIAAFGFQGIQAHTAGAGANLTVKLILGPAEMVDEKKVVEKKEIPEKEKEEISFEAYEALENERWVKMMIRYSIAGAIAILFFVVLIVYIGYQKRKKPVAPFMEGGGEA